MYGAFCGFLANQRGRLDWISMVATCPHMAQTLRDIHSTRMLCTAQSSATASLVAASSTAQNAVSVDHKHLSTDSAHNLPWGREQDCFTSAAYQMEMSTDLEEMRWCLSVFAMACLFSPPCLCLLREGSICTSCFWRAELRYCLLNAELGRIWTSFRDYNRKKIHCFILRCCLLLRQILLVLFTCAFLWFPCFLQIPPNKRFLCSLSWVCSHSLLTSTG